MKRDVSDSLILLLLFSLFFPIILVIYAFFLILASLLGMMLLGFDFVRKSWIKSPIKVAISYCMVIWILFASFYRSFSRLSISNDHLYQDSEAIENVGNLYGDLLKSIDKRFHGYLDKRSFLDLERQIGFLSYDDEPYVIKLNRNGVVVDVRLSNLVIELFDYYPLDRKIEIFVRMAIDSDSCSKLDSECYGYKGISEHKTTWEIDVSKTGCLELSCIAILKDKIGPADHRYRLLFLDYLKQKNMVNRNVESPEYGLVFNKYKFIPDLHSNVFRRGALGYGRSLYFSGVTFLTTGYGDMFPLDTVTRFLVLLEGALGSFGLVLLTSALVARLQTREKGE